MAGMFYSLLEVVEKLQKTEEQIKQIVRQGRLREFRDGPNLLFKVDEVEALMAEVAAAAPEEPPAPEPPVEAAALTPEEPLAPEPPIEEAAALTPEEPQAPEPPIEEAVALTPEEPLEPEPPTEEAAALTPEEPLEPEPPMPEEQVLEEKISLAPESTEELTPVIPEELHEELLAESEMPPESELPVEGELPVESEMAGADTAITDQEIDLLGETEITYQPTEDTMAETKITPDETALSGTGEMPMAGSAAGESPLMGSGSGEASLEEIEEDVNLDSFGSGSGLLDLSLQADDTSLGGILDEIYTPEGEEEAGTPATAAASAMEVAAETEEILAETPRPGVDAAVMARAYIEPEPDAVSNAFGYMLFLPLLAVIYSSIIVIAGQIGVIPSILAPIQKFILPIMGGLAVVALVIVGIPLMQSMGGAQAGAKPKAKKAKKEKKPKKPKKPKKAKG
jgi:hypothetical protein